LEFLAYPATYFGGVRVAVGDVNGDGQPDIITGPGAGILAEVRVFNGQNGQPLIGTQPARMLLPYGVAYSKGLYVAAGDITGDGRADIIVGPGTGPAKRVKAFDGAGTQLLPNGGFLPYGPKFTGGVRVAAGDLSGDARAEIVTARGSGASQVRIFDQTGLQQGPTIKAFTTLGGNFVAVSNVDGDIPNEIIVGAEATRPQVKFFQVTGAADNTPTLTAYANNFRGGVRVGVLPGLDQATLLTAPGKGLVAEVRRFDPLLAAPLNLLDAFFAYDDEFKGGAFVAGA
jgi:hypothetical protein